MAKNKQNLADKSKSSNIYETIIIGGGIAGISASIYAARKRMKYELIASDIGGQMYESGEIINYPGIKKSTGSEFIKIFSDQLKFNDVKPIAENVKKVEKSGENFKVITDKKTYFTQTVIICTGARARKLNAKGEDKLAKRGVTYCAICDGPLFSGMDVAVIGGGDSASEAVHFLEKIAKKIYLINKNPAMKGHKYLIENLQRMQKEGKVEFVFNAHTKEFIGDKFLTGIKIEQNSQNGKSRKERIINVAGAFIEIGRVPNADMVKGLVDLDDDGHVIIDKFCSSSVPGIFAAGDCTDVHGYQYAISSGHGVMCLLKAADYIAKKGNI